MWLKALETRKLDRVISGQTAVFMVRNEPSNSTGKQLETHVLTIQSKSCFLLTSNSVFELNTINGRYDYMDYTRKCKVDSTVQHAGRTTEHVFTHVQLILFELISKILEMFLDFV